METKRCTVCGVELPLSEFASHAKTSDGLRNVCKSCCAKKKELKSVKAMGGNPALKDFKSRELLEELKVRGYKGKLYFVNEIKL